MSVVRIALLMAKWKQRADFFEEALREVAEISHDDRASTAREIAIDALANAPKVELKPKGK